MQRGLLVHGLVDVLVEEPGGVDDRVEAVQRVDEDHVVVGQRGLKGARSEVIRANCVMLEECIASQSEVHIPRGGGRSQMQSQRTHALGRPREGVAVYDGQVQAVAQ